ncbi:MAG: hypothetical protein OQK04_12980, partial [Kangiellaceae bacterium]|nr:hypothetical protein [Kangiellaceae bacterium]
MKERYNLTFTAVVFALLVCSNSLNAQTRKNDEVRVNTKPKQTLNDPYEKKPARIARPTAPVNPGKSNNRLTTKPIPRNISVQTKTYSVPGPLAISKAMKHGYTFSGDHNRCKFNGTSAWTIQPNPNQGRYCKMSGFSPLR